MHFLTTREDLIIHTGIKFSELTLNSPQSWIHSKHTLHISIMFTLKSHHLNVITTPNQQREDIESLKVIDNMSFKAGVQLYSKINKIIYCYVDTTKDKDKDKIRPEKLVTLMRLILIYLMLIPMHLSTTQLLSIMV